MGTTEVELSIDMLNAMLRLAETYTYRVTAIAGGEHSSNSLHYAGTAFDVDVINDVEVGSDDPYHLDVRQICFDLGAEEAFDPNNDPDVHVTHVHLVGRVRSAAVRPNTWHVP